MSECVLWRGACVCVCVRVHVSVCDASGSREFLWSEQGTTTSGQGTGTVPEEVGVLVVQGTGSRDTAGLPGDLSQQSCG